MNQVHSGKWQLTTRMGEAVAALALAIALGACTTTQAAKPELPHGTCAYLAPNICSELTPGAAGQASLRYIAPNVTWSQYTMVMISPVTVWGGAKNDIGAADAQYLANYLYQAMVKQVGAKFKLVDEPGPGVLKLQIAITSAEAAVPVLRTVSMLVPQARVLSTLKYVATGSYPFVGGAQGEAEVTDSVTGQVLAAAVDRRIGGGSLGTAAQWQLGDAENVMDNWATLTATRLADFRAGKS
jgi:hypothetical protein